MVVCAAGAAALPSLAQAGVPGRSDAPPPAARADDDRHILVRFRAGAAASERAALHRRNAAAVAGLLRAERVEVVRLARGDSVEAALGRYRRDSDVEFAEPNKAVSLLATPDDTYFPGNGASVDLWGLHNTGQNSGTSGADIDGPQGWDTLSFSGSPWPTANFAVGVIDTGVDAAHEDLAGKAITPCYTATSGDGTLATGCADDNDHGTHVAGTIAATGNNGKGIVGVAPNARIYACKALDAAGEGYVADVVACMNEIVAKRTTHNIRVLSMSLGSETSSETEKAAVDAAWDSGVLVVAAAGNEGDSTVSYPAGYDTAVSVAATDRNDARASFSNTNSDVELSAPGAGIVSTVPGGYASFSGTSMATPQAAAVAALVGWKYSKSGQALRDHVDAAVDDRGTPGRDSSFGFGRVDLCRALAGTCDNSPPAAPTALTAQAGDGRVTLDWADSPASDVAGYRVYRRNPDGSWSSTPHAATTTSAFTDTGLANATTYTYRVTAVDQANNESFASAQASAAPRETTPPAQPTALTAQAGDGRVTLDWADNPDSDLAGYRLYRRNPDGSWPSTPHATTTTSGFADTTVTIGSTYTYRVSAYDSSGNQSAASSEAAATPTVKRYRSAGVRSLSGSIYRGRGALWRLHANGSYRYELSAKRKSSGTYVSDFYSYARVTAAERRAVRKLSVNYDGNATSGRAARSLYVYSYAGRRWVRVFGPKTAVTSDRRFGWSTTSPRSYLSSTGAMRFRVRGTRRAGFRTRTDVIGFRIAR